MCRCNTEGMPLNVNQTLVTMLGYTSKEQLLEVRLLDEIIADDQKRLRMLRRADSEAVAAPLEVDWKQKNGASLKSGSAEERQKTNMARWMVTKSSSRI